MFKILYVFIITHMRATCLVHLILHDLLNLNIFGKGYEFPNTNFLTVEGMLSSNVPRWSWRSQSSLAAYSWCWARREISAWMATLFRHIGKYCYFTWPTLTLGSTVFDSFRLSICRVLCRWLSVPIYGPMKLQETCEIRVYASDVYHHRCYVTITCNGGRCVKSWRWIAA
jgi:hypothetical protein